MDPTLPGIPADQIAHDANLDTARSIVLRRVARYLTGDERAHLIDDIATALTAAELRGFEKGMESVKPAAANVPRRNCWACAHDYRDDDGVSCCANKTGDDVMSWLFWNEADDDGMPAPDADNCPGWAPKKAT